MRNDPVGHRQGLKKTKQETIKAKHQSDDQHALKLNKAVLVWAWMRSSLLD